MVVFVENPPARSWRRQGLAYLPGMIVGLGVAFALRRTGLPGPTRMLLTYLPMFFLFTFFGSPMAGPKHAMTTRVLRAAAYSLVVSLLLYVIMRA
jgi:hypothetical protein